MGYWDTTGTAAFSASGMKGGVGSRGSPMEKSTTNSPRARMSRAFSCSVEMG